MKNPWKVDKSNVNFSATWPVSFTGIFFFLHFLMLHYRRMPLACKIQKSRVGRRAWCVAGIVIANIFLKALLVTTNTSLVYLKIQKWICDVNNSEKALTQRLKRGCLQKFISICMFRSDLNHFHFIFSPKTESVSEKHNRTNWWKHDVVTWSPEVVVIIVLRVDSHARVVHSKALTWIKTSGTVIIWLLVYRFIH